MPTLRAYCCVPPACAWGVRAFEVDACAIVRQFTDLRASGAPLRQLLLCTRVCARRVHTFVLWK